MLYELGFVVYLIGLIGYFGNRRNFLFMLLSLELMLLAIAFIFIFKALSLNDLSFLTYTLFILVLAGVETAVGLTLFIQFYRLKDSLSFS